jgi:hypothetical protein
MVTSRQKPGRFSFWTNPPNSGRRGVSGNSTPFRTPRRAKSRDGPVRSSDTQRSPFHPKAAATAVCHGRAVADQFNRPAPLILLYDGFVCTVWKMRWTADVFSVRYWAYRRYTRARRRYLQFEIVRTRRMRCLFTPAHERVVTEDPSA